MLLDGAATGDVNPNVKLWGYASGAGIPQYLGGVIVATGGNAPVPVKLEITNELPATTKILPVDTTLIDPASGVSLAVAERVDRIAVHLHGGFVFWDSDGGPFHWFSSASPNVEDGPSFINGNHDGTAVYFYPNQQSARFLWYHDHAYGVTRTNAYSGLASAYLITDSTEQDLINRAVIPGLMFTDALHGLLGIPLIIQDKTFWDPTGNDPEYTTAVPDANPGDLWYPHKYEGGLDPTGLPDMGLPSATPGITARWGTTDESLSNNLANSSVPEFFSDTILVNGAPYPTLEVSPQRYRFRFLNASQGRFYNLQLYVAENTDLMGNPNLNGINLTNDPSGETDPNDNPILVPRNAPGPAFVQIANEAGFLPAPAIFSAGDGTNTNSNRVMRYLSPTTPVAAARRADAGREIAFHGDRLRFTALPGDPTEGNPRAFNLLIAPAERPDVIIDFRQTDGSAFPSGTEFILYSDAPAPFPGGDTRNDYFRVPDPVAAGLPSTWSNNLVDIGGAAPAADGQGPDTRILMKFIVKDETPSNEPAFADWVNTLETELPLAFAARGPQDTPFTEAEIAGARTLIKTLGEDNDEHGRLRQYLGNTSAALRTYLDFPTEVALEDELQVWEIYNTTADTHPMHFHLVNVQVVNRQQWAFNPDGTPMLPLHPLPGSIPTDPDPNEMGWRETVRMNPGEITRVAMRFSLPKATNGVTPATAHEGSPRLLASYGIGGTEYVWHCHILEHEEHDMMRSIVVIPKTPVTPAAATPQKK